MDSAGHRHTVQPVPLQSPVRHGLELELRRGARPDVVVVSDGLNDVASAVINGRAGVPQNEANRVRDFHLGRLLASDQDMEALAALGLMAADRSQLLQRLAAVRLTVADSGPPPATLAHEVADTYGHTAELLEALAKRYHFRVCTSGSRPCTRLTRS